MTWLEICMLYWLVGIVYMLVFCKRHPEEIEEAMDMASKSDGGHLRRCYPRCFEFLTQLAIVIAGFGWPIFLIDNVKS